MILIFSLFKKLRLFNDLDVSNGNYVYSAFHILDNLTGLDILILSAFYIVLISKYGSYYGLEVLDDFKALDNLEAFKWFQDICGF